MGTLLNLPRGIDTLTSAQIPKVWDADWFSRFLQLWLANADVRNATGVGGITISGNAGFDGTLTLGAGSVNVSQLAPIPPNTILANPTGSTAPVIPITRTQLTALVNTFSNSLAGDVPSSGGGTTNFLRADGTWASPPGGQPATCLALTLDGGGSVIPTGNTKVYFTIPFNGTITAWYITGDPSGSVVIDVWKLAGAIPTGANTIAGSELPTLASAPTANDTTLTTWTTSVLAGDIFGFNVNSATTVTKVVLTIEIIKT